MYKVPELINVLLVQKSMIMITVCLFSFLVPYIQSKECGKELSHKNRIIGGHFTTPYLYPWMVYYSYEDVSGDENVCGGSLISDRIVLTAKHCLKSMHSMNALKEAKVGVHNISSPDYEKVEFKKYFYHITKPESDIAILLLKEPVDLEDPRIGTVCLPETENEEYIGEQVKAMGWGMTGKHKWEDILKTVDLVVDELEMPYLLFTKVEKIEGVYQDPCAGDSGSPLVHKQDGHWTIIGTVLGGGYNCNSEKQYDGYNGLGVWNKVTDHLTWIKQIMKRVSGSRKIDKSGDKLNRPLIEKHGHKKASLVQNKQKNNEPNLVYVTNLETIDNKPILNKIKIKDNGPILDEIKKVDCHRISDKSKSWMGWTWQDDTNYNAPILNMNINQNNILTLDKFGKKYSGQILDKIRRKDNGPILDKVRRKPILDKSKHWVGWTWWDKRKKKKKNNKPVWGDSKKKETQQMLDRSKNWMEWTWQDKKNDNIIILNRSKNGKGWTWQDTIAWANSLRPDYPKRRFDRNGGSIRRSYNIGSYQETSGNTSSPTPSLTPSPTSLPIPSPTPQPSVSETSGNTPLPTPSPTPSPIPSPIPSPTPRPSGSDCERCTENVESLSSDKIGILLEAMKNVMHTSPTWERISSLHGEPVRPQCDNAVCSVHSDDGGFLPWHRIYVNIMNVALQKYETSAIMPYWDWTTSDFPTLARSAQLKNHQTGQYMENPFFRGFQAFSQNFSTRIVNATSTSNNLRDVLAALQEDDFLLFSTQFNLIHNGIHRYVGGSMARLAIASYDPIFYLHHAFVDLVWAVYQKLKPNSRPSDSVLQQRLLPFNMTIDQTLTLTRKWYNLDMKSDTLVFGGMTLAQIQNRISRKNQQSYSHEDNRIYAGFFLRSFKTDGIIKFNICNLEDCSYLGGEVSIFGGKHEKSYTNSNPSKVDVTEAVINAGIKNINNVTFMVTSFEDLEGNCLPIDVYQPITVARSTVSGDYAYGIFFNKTFILPPKIRIPKYISFQIVSPYEVIYGTENENNFLNCDPKDSVHFSSRKPINVTADQYYFFDDNCRPQTHEYSVSKINIIRQ